MMFLAIDCLASTGTDYLPAIVTVAVLFVGGILAIVAGRRSLRVTGAAVLALALILGATGIAAPAPAFAVACTPAPSATPTPTPSPQPTGSVAGTYLINGENFNFPSPAGVYPNDPGTDWFLPTFVLMVGPAIGATITLTGAGADGVLDTADDTTSTTTTDAAGHYVFSGLTDGPYRVTATDPVPNYESRQRWQWQFGHCTMNAYVSALVITSPTTALHDTIVTDASTVTGLDFTATNHAGGSESCD